MTANTSTIVGIFSDYNSAEKASRAIIESGVPSDSVHVQSNNRTAAAGRSTGASSESEGGISGFFHRLFGGDDEGSQYTKAVEGGRSVVIIDAADAVAERTVELLNEYGAIDIEDGDQFGAGYAGADSASNADIVSTDMQSRNLPMSDRPIGDRPMSDRESMAGNAIPVIDEELVVGRRSVQRGGVRVYSRMVERPVEEQVRLRDEHVRVERHPVDRPISEAELSGLRDQSYELTETVEEPVIQKVARVTEEIRVGKETTEKTQTIRDTVRHTDVQVERFEGEASSMATSSPYDTDFRDHWQSNYQRTGSAGTGSADVADYSAYAPAYNYGYQSANSAQYKGRGWNEVESDLKSDYERNNAGGTWERMKNAVRFGWDKVTGDRQ